MLSKSFFGPGKTEFWYEPVSEALTDPVAVALPEKAIFLIPQELPEEFSENIKIGAAVKTGQKLVWGDHLGETTVSSVSGTISVVGSHDGPNGHIYTAVSITAEKEDVWDDQFVGAAQNPTLQTLVEYFSSAPGGPPLSKLTDPEHPIHTIVIYGGDTDMVKETCRYVLQNRLEAVAKGIRTLKELSGVEKVIVAVPGYKLPDGVSQFPAMVEEVSNKYPMGRPLMVYYNLFGRYLGQGQSFEDAGVLFLRAEAVAAIGQAFTDGRVPVDKIITVVNKEGRKQLAATRIGTPVGAVIDRLGISINEGDRIIFGGPMTCSDADVYQKVHPILPDTDTIIIQDREAPIFSRENKCLNCEECVRICPSDIAVNILLRFIKSEQYKKAADLYDLYSCVECGQCYYVCNSAIPILTYIRKAKKELERTTQGE